MSIPCHTVCGAKKEVEVGCDKEWADGKLRDRQREKLVIFWWNVPACRRNLRPGMKKKNPQTLHDSDCEWWKVTLSLFTAFITLSITDYKCTLHSLLLSALLHHVVPSSLKLRPTREGQRSSEVPRRLFTVAVECSGCFIASGSNCTYILWSFVGINPTAGPLVASAKHQQNYNAFRNVKWSAGGPNRRVRIILC